MNDLETRVEKLNDNHYIKGDVVFCPVLSLRIADNPALYFAQKKAIESNAKLRVVFILYPNYIEARGRHYTFMFEGLKEFEHKLNEKNISLEIILGGNKEVLDMLIETGVGTIVTDYSPLRLNRGWKETYAKKCSIPFYDVNSTSVIPPRELSEKKEFAAYTIRPKVYNKVKYYLTLCDDIVFHEANISIKKVNWNKIENQFLKTKGDTKMHFVGGENASQKVLADFLENKLYKYSELRNDPNENVQSDLSPYITFGFISKRYIINKLLKDKKIKNIEDVLEKNRNAVKVGTPEGAFIEELLVRSGLAENFCYYDINYDNIESFPDWAKKSHAQHINDKREYVYSLEHFEKAETHDTLWNAAQNQMLKTGKMHGYMRMYWAKKILEWTESPDEAMKIAVYLNDTYSLDGRNPNGYAGIAWSIGGVHDRAWFEREVFGQIRYMNYNGCKSKFDVKKYENTWNKKGAQEKLF